MSQNGTNKSEKGFDPTARFQQTPIKDAPVFSLHAKKGQSNKFISHLLGLDHEHTGPGPAPSAGSAREQQAVQGVKLKDMFHGIKFTTNFMFFLLFFGFFCWLFVIYWVRHNEPLADSVLGTPKVNARSADADRRLVNGTRNAFPMQTSASSGTVYVPGSTSTQQVSPSNVPAPQQQAAFAPGYQVAPAPQVPITTQQGAGQYGNAFGAPGQYQAGASDQMGTLPPTLVPNANPSTQVPIGQGNYLVGVQTNSGTRVKTVVSR